MKIRSKVSDEPSPSQDSARGGQPSVTSNSSRYGNGFMQEQLAERTAGVPGGAVGHVGGKASVPDGNFGPAPRVQDGSAEQAEVIRNAVTEARRMAAVGLGVLRAGASTARDRQLLESHFHTTDPSVLVTASQVLTSTFSGMNGELPIEVEATSETIKGEAVGYVYGGPFAGVSDIHLTPKFFAQNASDQGATVLHESTHKFAGTEDHAYGGPGPYATLTPEEALENADSYARFCQQHLADNVRVEEEDQRRKVEEAARTHGEEAWLAWESGKIVLGKDGFTTTEGVELPIGVVKGIVLRRFSERFPGRYEDIVNHLQESGGRYGPVTCGDGYSASAELVRLVGDEEML